MTDDTHRTVPDTPDSAGRLVENLTLFARTLRAAGLPVGPGKVLEALRAVQTVGIERRDDLYWTLHAVFVTRRDQVALFDQAFHLFWRNPKILDRVMQMLLPEFQKASDDEETRERIKRRLQEAMQQAPGEQQETEKEELEVDATLTWSQQDILRTKDFEQMSTAEMDQAKRAIRDLELPIDLLRTRRTRAARTPGRADLRRTMRAALRSGSGDIPIKWQQQTKRPPPLVLICDISGSMAQYSRMVLHFMHAVTSDRDRVHSFVFGTRLTNITHYLRHKDVDKALEKVGSEVTDWEGGTRIGACLDSFNRVWSRRVLAQGATVLLITDGLDRDNADGLARAVERLHKSCRQLIWLNPLLRYGGYQPKSMGAKAIMPHVDAFRAVHSLESLEDLAQALAKPAATRQEGLSRWLEMVET